LFDEQWLTEATRTTTNIAGLAVNSANASTVNASVGGVWSTHSKLRRFHPATSFKKFLPTLSLSEKQALVDSVVSLVNALDQFNISYHMCGGTLLGSFLHHGLIPWDDDVDLCVAHRDYFRLISALDSATSSRFSVVLPRRQRRLKFFSKAKSTPISKKGVTWQSPFVDICLYNEDDTTIWDFSMGPPDKNPKRFPKSIVFPLGRRPFMNMSLRAPRHSRAYLEHNYRLDLCVTNRWSHVLERSGRELAISCRKLWPLHPFVFRAKLANGTILETLQQGNNAIGSVIVDELGSLIS
jgi:hypothetical protein